MKVSISKIVHWIIIISMSEALKSRDAEEVFDVIAKVVLL